MTQHISTTHPDPLANPPSSRMLVLESYLWGKVRDRGEYRGLREDLRRLRLGDAGEVQLRARRGRPVGRAGQGGHGLARNRAARNAASTSPSSPSSRTGSPTRRGSLGVSRGDRVMVLLGKVPEWHVILTGLLKLGAIAIPCAPQLRAGDLKFRAEHSGSVAMISGPEGIEEVEKMRADAPGLEHFISLGEERDGWESYEVFMDGASEDFTAEDTAAGEGAFILYTSGTTKNPKGALHTHGYTHAAWMQARYWLDLREGDRLWCTSGTGWAKSIWNIFLGPWSQGTEIFFHEGGFDPAERLDLIERYDISVLCQAPTEYRLLAKTPGTGTREPRLHSPRRLRRENRSTRRSSSAGKSFTA